MLVVLIGGPVVVALYEWRAVAVLALVSTFVQYRRIESLKAQLDCYQSFVHGSEVKYDFDPYQPRPSEEQLLRMRRERIEASPEILRNEWHEGGSSDA